MKILAYRKTLILTSSAVLLTALYAISSPSNPQAPLASFNEVHDIVFGNGEIPHAAFDEKIQSEANIYKSGKLPEYKMIDLHKAKILFVRPVLIFFIITSIYNSITNEGCHKSI